MIISASRRTDIPAFYSQWFINCLQKGTCTVKNPFNPAQSKEVLLLPEDVDIIVFWTRFPAPLLNHLDELDRMNYEYMFLYTITGYPRWLEPNAPKLTDTIHIFTTLSRRIGTHKMVWRYDPIIFSKDLDFDFHLHNFENIAKQLSGFTQRAIISIMEPYKKVQRRFALHKEYAILFNPFDIFNNDDLYTFFSSLGAIAAKYDMHIQTCCSDISRFGIPNGACIDAQLIQQIIKTDKMFAKDLHQRPHCLCAKSIDIGTYNTCKFGCVYCYANR
ncbi:MAG: DUF1848 domain-containing protein [Spirochaetes bacterium]|nr:DUF1848 domain-containing protein [Spirochaetota bacterium]